MTPCGCEDGDYRDECWNNCDDGDSPQDPREGGSCPQGSGTHWDPAARMCVPDAGPSTGGGSNCVPGSIGCDTPCPEGSYSGIGPGTGPNGGCIPRGGGGGGGGGGGAGGGGGNFGGFPPSRPRFPEFGPVPEFDAPDFRFTGPTPEDVLNEPGYQFRRNEGERALQQSAAGRGLLRSGGTLKDILSWGQNFAAQEYQNVFDRKYGVARDTYDRNYQGLRDEYSPRLLEWQTRASASQRQAELEFARMWQEYVFSHLSASDIFSAGQD